MRTQNQQLESRKLAHKRVLVEFACFLGRDQTVCSAANSIKSICPTETLTIGRSSDQAQFSVPNDRSMSRRHLELSFDGQHCFVRDLNSSNGTFVNDDRVTSVELKNGDLLRAGKSIFMIAILEAPRPLVSKSRETMDGDAKEGASSLSDTVANESLSLSDTQPLPSLPTIKEADQPLDFEECTLFLRPGRKGRPARSGSTVDMSALSFEAEGETAGPPEVVTIRLLEESHIDKMNLVSRVLTWIRKEQKITIGSSDQQADWRLPSGASLEPIHFELEHNGEECTVRGLSCESHIKVNGQEVMYSELRDGDRVEAGNSVFLIEFA